MTNRISPRWLRAALFGFSGAALLAVSACNNTYGPPVDGKPLNWGQQHYLDNQRYQQLNEDRLNN